MGANKKSKDRVEWEDETYSTVQIMLTEKDKERRMERDV